MEKVAILTHSVANNYGANLQALSTAWYLKNHGYEPIFLHWGSYLSNNTTSAQVKIHQNFLKNNGFSMSEPLKTDKEFANYINTEKIERIIVGSDCVLTYEKRRFPFRLTRKGFVRIKQSDDYMFPNPFWLSFLKDVPNIKRCLMSASCGGSSNLNINENDVRHSMKELLGKFDYISVRDTFTAKFVRRLLHNQREIKITPDPVFGFNTNINAIPTEEETRGKYGLTGKYYVISFYNSFWPNQKWADSLMDEAHKKGFKCVSILMPQGGRNSNFDIDVELPLDPMDWYALIKYSNGYIGNNMHPIIVAIHNKVPFFSFNIHGRSYLHGRVQLIKTSKEYDLLRRFSLQKYLVPQPLYPFVSVKKIVKHLISFETDKNKNASVIMQKEYDEMMKQIMKIIE